MIKLLFHIDTGLSRGGAEKVLCNLANTLDKSRFSVTVMTLWPQDPAPYLAPGVRYRSLYPAKNALTRYLYRIEAALGLAGRRIREEYDIEIAYLECGPTKVLSSSTNKKALKIAWVHCDLEKKQPDIESFVRKSRKWYDAFDHVVCVSKSVRESFVKLYGAAPPATVLYNVNDEAEILEKADAFVPERDDRPTMVAAGRLSWEKGFDKLIDACARLQKEGLNFRLRILGEGEERPNLERMIQANHLEDRVDLPGFQPNPYPHIKNADLVVCSSRYEGFSTVITEALILGRPVVTTPCAGMRELLGDSEYGMITDDLHAGLKQILTRPELLAHYQTRSALRGRDFQKENLIRKTEEFFLELLEGNE